MKSFFVLMVCRELQLPTVRHAKESGIKTNQDGTVALVAAAVAGAHHIYCSVHGTRWGRQLPGLGHHISKIEAACEGWPRWMSLQRHAGELPSSHSHYDCRYTRTLRRQRGDSSVLEALLKLR